MNRLTRSFAVLTLAVAGVSAGLSSAGCANQDLEPTPTQKALNITPVAVQPGWRKFAEENYMGIVMAELRAQPDATFVTDPRITASRRPGGPVELMAMGELDINDAGMQRMRRPYHVIWRQVGSGWDGGTARVGAGAASPQPLRNPAATGRAIAPATRAVTPADPTAMPPPLPDSTPVLPPANP